MNQQQTALSTIETAFASYEQVQADHLESLRDEQMPDIIMMNQQRGSAFDTLKNALDEYMAISTRNEDQGAIARLTNYKDRVSKLMALDDKISNEIKRHKAQIKESINRVNKGKTALHGYGNAGGSNRKAPRVLSMNR